MFKSALGKGLNMKAVLGLISLTLVSAGVIACPAHLRSEAAQTVQISDETMGELSRQLDLFTAYMQGDAPDLDAFQSESATFSE